jgi:hypothetical protein
MFTTLLCLLYPPLKGFSFDQDPTHTCRSLFQNTAFKGSQARRLSKVGHHCGIEPQLIKLEFKIGCVEKPC